MYHPSMSLFTRTGQGKGRLDSAAAQREVSRLASLPVMHRAFEWVRSHEREIAEFQLQITSIAAPPFHEEPRARFFAESLKKLGYAVRRDDIGNVVACAGEVPEADRVVAVSAHLDTVFPPETPVDVRREHNRLYGPGISDNGAGLAALWAVAGALRASGIQTLAPVVFIGNVGEEGEGDLRGIRHLFADEMWRNRIAAMLVLDGAGMDSIVAEALGSRRFEIRIAGPGGHSWSDFGVPNPIVAMGRVIDQLSRLPLPSSPKTTLSIGTISGGTSVNTIPDLAVMRVDLRSSAREEIDRLEALLRSIVEKTVSESQSPRSIHKQLSYEIRLAGDRPAADLDLDAPILHCLRAADGQLGIRSRIHRASTDANIPLSLGVDALAIGAGGIGGGAHTIREWFDPTSRDVALKRILLTILALAGVME